MSIKNEPYLNDMLNRNLYVPNNVYDINQNKLTNTLDKIVNFVSNNTISIENTLLSRVLSDNTKLEDIATLSLSKSLVERINKNLRTNYLPTVDINYDGISIVKPISYWKISKGEELDSVSKLISIMKGTLNIQKPLVSIEYFDSNSKDINGINTKYDKYNNYLFRTLGDGQRDILLNSLNKNKYKPLHGLGTSNNHDSDDVNIYGNNPTDIYKGLTEDSILNKRFTQISESNSEIDAQGYSYNPENYTNISNPRSKAYTILQQNGQRKLKSRGAGTLTEDTENTTDDSKKKFLRVFTEDEMYGTYNTAMKYDHGRLGSNSVLQKVVPNIFPINENDTRKLMFCITNLAQNNNNSMWFVPYNLTLSENISNNYERVNFIGRNEPVYTYNGTERRASIGFTLIADYPAELNNLKWQHSINNKFDRFFREPNFIVDQNEPNDKEVEIFNTENKLPDLEINKDYGYNQFTSSNPLKYYFDNDDFSLKTPTSFIDDNINKIGEHNTTHFLATIDYLTDFLNSEYGKYYRVKIIGTSSKAHTSAYNYKLSYKRAYSVYRVIFNNMEDKTEPLPEYTYPPSSQVPITSNYLKNKRFTIEPMGERYADAKIPSNDVKAAMKDRYVALYLELDPNRIKNDNDGIVENVNINNLPLQNNRGLEDTVGKYFFQERDELHDFNKNINYDSIQTALVAKYSENIKYFQPVYHSQTPKDLNERLTFLQQCCRQGNSSRNPNSLNADDNIGNSIFGKPPVCVLRLGDFFNTKILIESINFDYEPLIWDVNPEGIGMQPMICNVQMECVILGGSDLSAPVNRLQNALSRNYYANTDWDKK